MTATLVTALALTACGGGSETPTDETRNAGGSDSSTYAGAGGGTGASGAATGGKAGIGGGGGGAQAGGGGTGQAGGGGIGAASGSGGGGVKWCPSKAGPALVEVPSPSGGTMCIDETEVTVEQYQAFVSAGVSLGGQPPVCAANKSYERDGACSQKKTVCTGPDCPVTCVDWCDAHAYCAWAGKRLCGAFSGGAVNPNDIGDPKLSQWMHVCSSGTGQFGAKNSFPYGNTFDPLVCDTADGTQCDPYATCKALHVKSHPGCVATGDFAGIYDMSGKVWEWEDNCGGGTCRVRGGSAYSVAIANACGYASDPLSQLQGFDSVGFRCCSLLGNHHAGTGASASHREGGDLQDG
jgi:formylglycine-generating enzyme